MEADFLREYGVRLAEALPHMGWREFRNLLRGLSPDCALRRHWHDRPRTGERAAAAFWHGLQQAGGGK